MKHTSQHARLYPTKLVDSVGGNFEKVPPIHPDPEDPSMAEYRVPCLPVIASSVPLTKEEVDFNRRQVEKRGAAILWTFFDAQDPDGEAARYNLDGGAPYAITNGEDIAEGQEFSYCSLVRINTDFFTPLLSPPQTPEDGVERTILQGTCAITVRAFHSAS